MQNYAEKFRTLSSHDFQLLEEEHALLAKFLQDIRDTCCNLDNQLDCGGCEQEKFASCHGRMHSFLHDLLEIAGQHFYHEELIMLNRPSAKANIDYISAHQQAHAYIMQNLEAVIENCTALDQKGVVADGYRQLYKTISSLFTDHTRSFDDPFIKTNAKAD